MTAICLNGLRKHEQRIAQESTAADWPFIVKQEFTAITSLLENLK